MSSDDPDDLPTREELAQRVRQLEEQQSPPIGRRSVVAGVLALAGVPALARRASAQAGGDRGSACEWLGDQNAAGYDLLGLAHTFMGEQSDTPADSDYGANEVAVYVKDDGNLYIRPNGGSEEQVSGTGGAGAWSDLGTDTDGGDNYGLPKTADNVDLQGDGSVRNADLVSTEQIGNSYHFAEAFAGSDPDARLDNALANAGSGDTIILEPGTYDKARTGSDTIDKSVRLMGQVPQAAGQTDVQVEWATGTQGIVFSQILLTNNGKITDNDGRTEVFRCPLFGASPEVKINSNACIVHACRGGQVTFDANANNGIVDSCYGGTTVTDNGSNSIGDLG